jgi:DNA-binding NarL/FixJ family response regulator
VVGRDAELARIDAFVAAASEGARSLVITGEPGIGKTTLWRVALERCRGAGFEVLLARPAEEELPLTLSTLGDLFERRTPREALADQEEPIARGRAVLGALRDIAAEGPVVLAIDDLQWIDAPSARALRFALRRLDAEPVGVLATLRSGSTSEDPLAMATTLPPGRTETLALGPLGAAALRRMLREFVEKISRPTLHRIHEVSGGNPLYAIELARGLSRDEGRRAGTGSLLLPDSLQAAIEGRLATVPDEQELLLQTLSALGSASVPQLRALLGTDVDGLLVAAERDGLLVVDESLEVRFSHPLIGSVVYASLPTLARRSLHARLAEATDDPDARARHLALSTDEPDQEVASVLEEASDRARKRGAPGLAAELAGHALRVTPPGETHARERRALLEIESVAEAGEVSEATALARRLLDTLARGPRRAEVLLRLSILGDQDRAATIAILEQARDEAGDHDSLRAEVLRELASMQGTTTGRIDDTIDLAREALATAERGGDRLSLMSTAAGLGYYEWLAGAGGAELLQRAVAIEAELEESFYLSRSQTPRTLLGKQLLWSGDLAGARVLFEAVARDSAAAGDEHQRAFRLWDLAHAACAAGELQRAHTLAQEGVEAARDAEDAYQERFLLCARALVDALLGYSADARSAAERVLGEEVARLNRPGIVRARSVLGGLALSEGNATEAARELTLAAETLNEIGIVQPAAFAPALPDAIEALASAGRVEEAEQLLDRLEHAAAAVDTPWPWAALHRARGVVLLAAGDADAATPLLAEAAAELDRLGYRVDAARAVLHHGRALLRAGRRSLAAEILGDARERFRSIGAALWEARAAAELERAAPGRAAGELTATEQKVAALVADGKRNREIGETLFMSVATVEAHLTRIYRKLGIRSRSELARLVAEGQVAGIEHGE